MIKRTLGLTIAVGLSLFLGIGTAVAVLQFNDPSDGAKPETFERETVPSPEPDDRELEVGVWQVGESPPDLIEGQTDDGKQGYMYAYDLANPPEPDADGNIILPVFERDGKTRIGSFTAGTAIERNEEAK